MIRCCIFDLDGTLVDSLEDLGTTVNQILLEYGFDIHPMDRYRKFVGNGVDKLIKRALPDEQESLYQEVRKKFDSLYAKNLLQHTKPYPGISELVTTLHDQGIILGVVTNKPHSHAKTIINILFPNQFTYVYGNQEGYPKKPDPYFIHRILQDAHVKKEDCLYIGDSDVDMILGNKANLTTIGASWGFRGKKELLENGADGVIASPIELLQWIKINKIALSSCLYGENCTYKGTNNASEAIMKLPKDKVVLICPEVLGGLSIPRDPCEITCHDPLSVTSINGKDCTSEYVTGAKKALAILKKQDVKVAVLKAKSPSCGKGNVYDGSFQHLLTRNDGVCTQLLERNGIEVYNEDDINWILKYIDKGEE